MRILLIFTLLFCDISCQNASCDSDECYKIYHGQIEKHEDMLSNLFHQFDVLRRKMKNLISSLADLNEELKSFPNNSWSDVIKAANESFKKAADTEFASEKDLNEIQKQISDWINFVENLNKIRNDIMNIPYSVASEIDFINSLLKDEKDENCLQKFHDELKKLFATIATFLRFEDFIPKLEEILKEAENNKKRAENILDESNSIMEKEKQLKKIADLANKTVEEANKLEELKKQISKLQSNEDAIQVKVDEAMKKFENDFKKLLKKYKSSKFEILLDKLMATTEELEELTEGEPVDIKLIEEDINIYSECLDCYQEFLTKCGKEVDVSKYCLKKIEECQDVV